MNFSLDSDLAYSAAVSEATLDMNYCNRDQNQTFSYKYFSKTCAYCSALEMAKRK